jgi:hypothetical protein
MFKIYNNNNAKILQNQYNLKKYKMFNNHLLQNNNKNHKSLNKLKNKKFHNNLINR